MLEYPELGMEAIWRIEVENFPAFIVVDDKGNDFFKELTWADGARRVAVATRMLRRTASAQERSLPPPNARANCRPSLSRKVRG